MEFKSEKESFGSKYQVGGSLSMNAATYVERAADCQLYQALKQREFCYVLNARQMGKSSLMVRTIHRLRSQGYRCTAIDMTRISGEKVTSEQWYKGLAVELWQGFDLYDRVNLKQWWSKHQNLSAIQKLSQFIEEVLLVETRGQDEDLECPIVICFDEIDSVLSLDFSINDFFALIRFCYNQRSINPQYRRLTFALFGVATPSDLIDDYRRTPFNIGRAIPLNGFNLQEAQSLIVGLKETVCDPKLILQEVLTWTNGQPFLTQKLCQLICDRPPQMFLNNEADWVEKLIQTRIIDNWQTQDEPEHLKTIRDRLLSDRERVGSLLSMYQRILQRGFIQANSSVEQQELLLAGLIIKQGNKLKVRNRIYQDVFDLPWIETQLSQLRPYSEALVAWQKSRYTDKSRLLRGQALKDAQKWSWGKSLSDLDYRFLSSSEKLDREQVQQALEAERANEIKARLLEKQKTVRIQRYFSFALSGALLSALGFGAIAYGQYRQAAFNEIQALSNYSEALFASNRRLDALIGAIEQKKKWEGLNYEDEATDRQIDSVLRKAIYGLDEYNRLSGHKQAVFAVDINSDGQLIATASSDKTVKLWQLNGTLLHTFIHHKAAVWDVAISPDSQTFVSGGRDRTVLLWQRDGRLLNQLKGHQDEVLGVAFSPNGQTIASASRDKTVKLWQKDGTLIDTLKGHKSSVWQAVFSPDGRAIATSSEDKTVKLWKLNEKGRYDLERTLKDHTNEVRNVVFSPDGKTIASVSHDRTAKLWERDSGKLLHTLEGHDSPITGVVFSPDSQRVITAGWDGAVQVWNLQGALLKTLDIEKNRIWDVSICPDGNTIVTASEQDTVKLSKLDNPLLKVLRDHSEPIIDVTFNPQSSIIATASDDRNLKFWDENGLLLNTFKSEQDSVLGVAWSRDGRRLISGHWNGAINFLQIEDADRFKIKLLKTVKGHQVGVWRATVSHDDKLIATASEDLTAKLWDWQGNLVNSFIGHTDVVRAVAFSPDDKIIATASYDETVKLWHTNGGVIETLKEHEYSVGALDISPDGKTMATADTEGIIILWQINRHQGKVTVEPTKTFKDHGEEVRTIVFSPNGQLFATASADSTIKLWHRSGKSIKTFYGHDEPVWSIAFSADSKTMVSASEDKTAITWNLEEIFQQDLLAAGCDQIQDYLRTNAELARDERSLCDNLAP